MNASICISDNAAEDTCNPLIDLKIPHVITVSEKVIDCPKLLIALESRYDIGKSSAFYNIYFLKVWTVLS